MEGSRESQDGSATSNAARRHLEPLPDGVRSAGGVWAVGMVRDEADIVVHHRHQPLGPGRRTRRHRRQPLERWNQGRYSRASRQTHPVTVLVDSMEAYYQSQKMTLLARAAARGRGELGDPLRRRRDLARDRPASPWRSGWRSATPTWCRYRSFNHVPTDHDDAAEPDPVRRLRWRKTQPNRSTRWPSAPTPGPDWP